jgi:uncharacterized phage protein (TIGR01671 family)
MKKVRPGMNKYIAWNEITKEKISWEELCKLDNDGILCLVDLILDLNPNIKLFKFTGKTDIHGQEIYYDFHVVKFKRDDGDSIAEYIGVFHFDQEHLRAIIETSEIDIWSRLWYEADDMSGFEIIGNVKENPELINNG